MKDQPCPYCELYAASREHVVRRVIERAHPDETDEQWDTRWERFLDRVHRRHAARLVAGRFNALMALVHQEQDR